MGVVMPGPVLVDVGMGILGVAILRVGLDDLHHGARL